MFKPKLKPGEDRVPVGKVIPFRKRKSIWALDLEGDTLRVAQASGHGSSARITKLASARLELPAEKRDQAPSLGAAIKKALGSLKLSPKEVALVLPRAQVILRPLQVPMVADLRELASVINFQVSKDLPFRLEDAVIDFKVLRMVEGPPAEGAEASATGVEKKLEVLVGAIRRDIVDFYQQVSKAAGFKLAALGLRSAAAAYCAERCAPVAPEGALLVLCIREDESTIDLVVDRKLVFSRSAAVAISASAEGSADRAAFLQALEIEVVRSLHSFEGSSPQKPVQRLVVAAPPGLERLVADSLAARLKIPAQLLDLSDCIDAKQRGELQGSLAVAPVGLALAVIESGGLSIDFVNPKKPAPRRNTKRTQVLAASVAGLVLLIGLFAIRMNLVKKRQQIKQQVQVQLTDAEKKLPIYRRLKSQTKVVNGWIAEDQNWLDHIVYLSSILPGADQLYVSTLTTTPQHLIRFSVQAKTGELLAELDKKLRAAGYEVRPLSITPASDKHGYNFRTTVELSIPKKMKIDLAKTKPPSRPPDDISDKNARKS